MKILNNIDLSLLSIRLGLGIMVFMHGIAKVINGVGGIKSMLLAKGLPEIMAYLAYVGEVIAPILLIVGVVTRFASFLVLVTGLTIIYVAHFPNLFGLTKHGGFSAEIVYLYVFMAIALMFSGSGRYALRRD